VALLDRVEQIRGVRPERFRLGIVGKHRGTCQK
jgi:hypothetical protein